MKMLLWLALVQMRFTKPSGDPQDKPHPLKIILSTKRKYQEHF